MAEQDDIFGKIDALLEKRVGFTIPTASRTDDFPLLTEVVDIGGRAIEKRQGERRVGDRCMGDRRKTPSADAIAAPTNESLTLPDAILRRLERRLEDLFIRQQLRLEEMIRTTVRQELARLLKDSDEY